MQGYADNDLEFEETVGQYTIANESLVSQNLNAIIHGESYCGNSYSSVPHHCSIALY